jgi:hypothetical protein
MTQTITFDQLVILLDEANSGILINGNHTYHSMSPEEEEEEEEEGAARTDSSGPFMDCSYVDDFHTFEFNFYKEDNLVVTVDTDTDTLTLVGGSANPVQVQILAVLPLGQALTVLPVEE